MKTELEIAQEEIAKLKAELTAMADGLLSVKSELTKFQTITSNFLMNNSDKAKEIVRGYAKNMHFIPTELWSLAMSNRTNYGFDSDIYADKKQANW